MTRMLLAIILVAAAGLVDPARAQTAGGGIRGIVRDATGAILAGVTVEATSPALIGTRVEVSDSQGLYQLERLPIGVYSVAFTLQGFTTVAPRERARGSRTHD